MIIVPYVAIMVLCCKLYVYSKGNWNHTLELVDLSVLLILT